MNEMYVNNLIEYMNNNELCMIDIVDKLIPKKIAIGVKKITNNEWYFPGHFPQKPILPGVLQLLAFVQMSIIVVVGNDSSKIENVRVLRYKIRLKREVSPGECLRIEVRLESFLNGVYKCQGIAFFYDELVSEASVDFEILGGEK